MDGSLVASMGVLSGTAREGAGLRGGSVGWSEWVGGRERVEKGGMGGAEGGEDC